MILQRGQPVPVWGMASPKEKVTVFFHGQKKTTITDKDGKWMLKLDPLRAGGPYQLEVKGNNKITVENILVGEVWICSGQSNMEMPIAGWGKINNYREEIAQADYPKIRQFRVEKITSADPKNDFNKGEWTVCSPKSVGNFTATGYFFARELYNQLHVPIGIIHSSWGGSMVETWISREAFEYSDEFKSMIKAISSETINTEIKQKKEALEKAIGELQNYDPKKGCNKSWQLNDFNDTPWPKIKLPGMWEQQIPALKDLDGVVWFRKTVSLEASDLNKLAVIRTGHADDACDVFINGEKLSDIDTNYSDNNSYGIPSGLLRAGENVVALRIEDLGGYGGIFANASDMYLKVGDKSLPLEGDWLYQVESMYSSNSPNSYPTLLFNTMINPLIPFAFKGVIWYQGESNATRAYQYRKAFPLMINDWRERWGQGNFPFYFVQLASFGASGGNSEKGSAWAELREAQTMTLTLPNTGMAVTIDIGDPHDIHPKNKQDVGKRLAAIALSKTYGQGKESGGPVLSSSGTDGNKIILSFSNAEGGLVTKDKSEYLTGFEVAGTDRKFYQGHAIIRGDSIIVYSDIVAMPVAVRYGWADDASEANLFNKQGFPAGPFRTDAWRGITDNIRYTITP